LSLLAIDASAMIARCLADEGWTPLNGYELVAPPLAFSETSSVLHEMAWRGELPQSESAATRARLSSAPVRVHVSMQNLMDAGRIADQLGWAKTYDAEYIALASRLDCPLLTIDGRLQRGASHLVRILSPADL
jgi:predicted nucleic acid-binding protein